MPELMIKEKGSDEAWVHECVEPVVSIGRLDTNVVQLNSDGVSRQHAKIMIDDENFFLIDLKSGNGTFLNGNKLKANEKYLLKPGDMVSIDTFDLRFIEQVSLKNMEGEDVTESDVLEVKLLKKVLTALDKEMVPSIEVLNGSAEGKKILLTEEVNELTIGRDPECDFPINEYVISRQHAKIIRRWGGIAVRDLESKNGTFLNNRKIVEEYLHDGDRVALGTIVFMFRNPQEINLSYLSDIKPKYRPAAVKPEDIPGLEDEPPLPEQPEEEPPKKEAKEGENDEVSAIEEWDELEKSISKAENYPVPKAKKEKIKSFSPIEIGLMGLGALILIFAVITIVNLLAS